MWLERSLCWHQRLIHCTFRYLLRIYKRVIITRNLINITPPPILLSSTYLRILKTGHGGTRENTQEAQSGRHQELDPGKWTQLTRWYITNQGSSTKSLEKSYITYYGRPLSLWGTNTNNFTPTSWGASQMSKTFSTRKPMSSQKLHTGPWSSITGQITEYFWIPFP